MTTEKLEVGRVIYTQPDLWRVQTLRNHVGNVVKLVELWDSDKDFLEDTPNLQETRKYLIRAAEIHDMGKPRRFKLVYDPEKKAWSYSFAGHRFDAQDHPGDEYSPYIEALAHLHHEYSVNGITEKMADMRLNGLADFVHHLPLDLYILEMCDQVEATIASALLDAQDPTARVFMDFQFGELSAGQYQIDPFVFKNDSVPLTIEWAEIVPDVELVTAVTQTATPKNDAYPERKTLRNWLVKQLQQTPLQTEVTICPWI